MLYPYKETLVDKFKISKDVCNVSPVKLILYLVNRLNTHIDTKPNIYFNYNKKGIYISYKNSAFIIDDIFGFYGEILASISNKWDISIQGTDFNNRNIILKVSLEDNYALCYKYSFSEYVDDTIENFFLNINFDSIEVTKTIYEIISKINKGCSVIPIQWKNYNFIKEYNLTDKDTGCLFCYICLNKDINDKEKLYSLDFYDKKSLWKSFLKDNMEYFEFSWLWNIIKNGEKFCISDWILSLEDVIKEIDFKIINDYDRFEIFNSAGEKLFFSSDFDSDAKKVLLNMLVPQKFYK